MNKTVSHLKSILFSLDPIKVQRLAILASLVLGVVVINSPGAGSGIGG